MRKRSVCIRGVAERRERRWQVRVFRERPTGLAWAVALAITMLMVYLSTIVPDADTQSENAFAAQRVSRNVTFEALEMHLVSLCSCASGEEARLLASGYTDRGAAGYIHENDDGWHVIGAAYEEARDAGRIAQRISKEEHLDAQVVSLSAPSVEMRITAPEIQINAIVEADALLRTQTAQLGSIALQLDREEISTGAACTLCTVASTRAEAGAQILEKIPGASENDVCKGLISCLNTLSGLLDTVAGAGKERASVLSGMIRCVQIDTFAAQADLQNRLVK